MTDTIDLNAPDYATLFSNMEIVATQYSNWLKSGENKPNDFDVEVLQKLLFNHATKILRMARENQELQAQIERGYQMLQMYGVPRERAKSLANGIDVLAIRCKKQGHSLNAALQELTTLRAANLAAQKLIDEGCEALARAEADAKRYRWLRQNSGYTIRCELFGEVGMREHDDNQLDELIDAAIAQSKGE